MTIIQIKRTLKFHSYTMETLQWMFIMLIRSSHRSGNPENNNIKFKSNGDSKTKIMVADNLLVKYLRRQDLSSKNDNVTVITDLGSTSEDMLDYIKTIARRKLILR